jgi:purine-binding chemotaxis protein CheW
MNLADIRKKAEENRKSATAGASERVVESAQPPGTDAPDFPIFEEAAFNQIEMPVEELPAESCVYGGQSVDNSVPLPETAIGLDEPLSEPLSVAAAITDSGEKQCPPVPSAPVPATKKSAGYNPIETILSGRESASASETHQDSQADSCAPEDVEEYLCFRVAQEVYAISIMSIKEIIKPRDVTEVPRMPAFISGVISLRGVIIPVMDMRLRLSLPVSATGGKERIIVLRRDSGFCGVLVDEVIQVARIKKSDLEEPPTVLDGIDRDFVKGLGHFDTRMLILLNLATILDIGVH